MEWGSLTYTWAKRGEQPTVKTSGKRKGYKVFGLIDYFTGGFFHKGQEERVNSQTYIAFLTEVLAATRKPIILVQDGARYHTSKALQEFFDTHARRLTVYPLPTYSPDYNPIEKLWKKIKERDIHLHYFPTFDHLKAKVEKALSRFARLRKEVLPLFSFYRDKEVRLA
jgi:transposase